MLGLDSGRSRYPAISPQSAEVAVEKNDSNPEAYEFRTKSSQSGGLETNGRISRLGRLVAVGRFVGEARGYGRFQRDKIQRRMLVAVGLAEGEELETNILQVLLRKCPHCREIFRGRNCGDCGFVSAFKVSKVLLSSGAGIHRTEQGGTLI